jgi:hypothetical protein
MATTQGSTRPLNYVAYTDLLWQDRGPYFVHARET